MPAPAPSTTPTTMPIGQQLATGGKELLKGIGRGVEEQILAGVGNVGRWAVDQWKNFVPGPMLPGTGGLNRKVFEGVMKLAPEAAQTRMEEFQQKASSYFAGISNFWRKQASTGIENRDEVLEKIPFANAPLAKTGQWLGEALPMYTAAIASVLVTKSPNVAGAMFGVQAGGETYRQAREAGESQESADLTARLNAAWTAATERIPFDAMLGTKGKPLLERVLKNATTETVQELFQGIGTNLIEKYGYDEGRDIWDGFLQALVVSPILGGAGGAMVRSSDTELVTEQQSTAMQRYGISQPATARYGALSPDERAKATTLMAAGYSPAVVDQWIMAENDDARTEVLKAYDAKLDESRQPSTEPTVAAIVELGQPTGVIPSQEVTPLAGDTGPTSPISPVLQDAQAKLDELTASPEVQARFGGRNLPLRAVERPADPAREQEIRASENAAVLLGKRIVWFEGTAPEQRALGGTVTDDTVFINSASKNPYQSIVMHETLHRMKQTDADLYQQLLAVAQEEGSGFDQFKADLLDRYEKAGVTPSENDAWVWEEMVAETLGERGTDAKFWSDLYAKSPDVVQRLVDTIRAVIDSIRGIEATPEMAQFYNNFQRVHDTAVSVISEYSARKQTAIPANGMEAAAVPAVGAIEQPIGEPGTALLQEGARNAPEQEAQGRQGQALLEPVDKPVPAGEENTTGAGSFLVEGQAKEGKAVEFYLPNSAVSRKGRIHQVIDDQTLRIGYIDKRTGNRMFADVPTGKVSEIASVRAIRARAESMKDLTPEARKKVNQDARAFDEELKNDREAYELDEYKKIEYERTERGKSIATGKWMNKLRAIAEEKLGIDEDLRDPNARAKHLPKLREVMERARYQTENLGTKPDAPYTVKGKRGSYSTYFDGETWYAKPDGAERYRALDPEQPAQAAMIEQLRGIPELQDAVFAQMDAAEQRAIREEARSAAKEKQPVAEVEGLPFSVEGRVKTWYRGTPTDGTTNASGDLFYSASKGTAQDYAQTGMPRGGKITKHGPEVMPSNPLRVESKEALAETMGEADPDNAAFALDFDAKAKAYARERGHDGILYDNGSQDFNTGNRPPELHVFRGASNLSIEDLGSALDDLFDTRKESKYAKKVAGSGDRLSPELRKAAEDKILFEKKTQPETAKRAMDWIEENGYEKARLKIISREARNELEPDELLAAGEGIYHIYDAAARSERNQANREMLHERGIEAMERTIEDVRGVARALAYLRTWSNTMTDPAGARAIARRVFNQANSKQMTEEVELEQKNASAAVAEEFAALADELLSKNDALNAEIKRLQERDQRRTQEGEQRKKLVKDRLADIGKNQSKYAPGMDARISAKEQAKQRLLARMAGKSFSIEDVARFAVEEGAASGQQLPDEAIADFVAYAEGWIAEQQKAGKKVDGIEFLKTAEADFGKNIAARADLATVLELAQESYVDGMKEYADYAKQERAKQRKKPAAQSADLGTTLEQWASSAGITEQSGTEALAAFRRASEKKLAEHNLIAFAKEHGFTEEGGAEVLKKIWEEARTAQSRKDLFSWANFVGNQGLSEEQMRAIFDALPWKSPVSARLASKLAPASIQPPKLTTQQLAARDRALINRIGLVRKTLKDMKLTIADAVRQHYGEREATRQGLLDRILDAGIPAQDATKLAALISGEFNKLIDAKSKDILKRKYLQSKNGKRTPIDRTAMGEIITALKLGAATNQAVADAIGKKYGLSVMTPEITRGLNERSLRIQEAVAKYGKDSQQVQDLEQETMRFIGSHVKKGWRDVASAWIHTSLLSGSMTHALNLFANALNATGILTVKAQEALVDFAKGDRDALRSYGNALGYFFGGLKPGLVEGANTLATGYDPIKFGEKFEKSPAHLNPFEVDPRYNKLPMKYVRRFLAAEDMLSFMPLKEFQTALMLAKVAKEEGKTGKALTDRVSELMGYDETSIAKYRQQAKAEGLEGLDFHRRVNQLIERSRPAEVNTRAVAFGKKETFNTDKPGGVFGMFAEAADKIATRLPVFRPLALFTRIIANVGNMNVEYSPFGFYRAATGKVKVGLFGNEIHTLDAIERRDALYKAINGTALTSMALTAAWAALKAWEEDPEKDKKNPAFSVSAMGPTNPNQRKIWMQQGNKPYTLRFGDGEAISFGWIAPVAIPLSIAGGLMDYERFNKGEDEDEEGAGPVRLISAMFFGMTRYIQETSPMAGANVLAQAFNETNDSARTERFKTFASQFTGFVVPNIVLQTAKFFDPHSYRTEPGMSGMWQTIFKNLPVVRGHAGLYQSLNIFGEPIENRPTDRFFKPVKDDPELKFLVDNNLKTPAPARSKTYYDPHTKHETIASELEYYQLYRNFGPRFRALLSQSMPVLERIKDKEKLKEHVSFVRSLALREAEAKLLQERFKSRD